VSLPADPAAALIELPLVISELSRARTAHTEAHVVELTARHATLRARLTGGDSVSAAERWAEIDAATAQYEKMRWRAKVEILTDQRDYLIALISSE